MRKFAQEKVTVRGCFHKRTQYKMHKRTLILSLAKCKRFEKKMLKCVLIYLWLYIGIYGAIEAGDADEHVHIKLHMPKSGARKTVHHQHTRHKKNPPPYAPSPAHGHAQASGMGSGPGVTQSHVYHESPHNLLTASAAQQSTPHHLHGQHIKKLPPSSSSSAVTHLQPVGGHHQALVDTEFYASEGGATAEAGTGSALDANGDFMLKEYLTANFGSFPQPTAFETEIMSPQTNAELAYHSLRTRKEQHHPYSQLRNNYHQQHHHHYYDGAAADVVAANHEVEEDNEILGTLGRPSHPMEDTEWTTTHHAKPYGGLSSVKAMKNEHLLKHLMQQQEQQNPSFPYQPEITNSLVPSALLRASNANYRDDKLHKTTREGARDDALEAMQAYDDMDMVTTYGVSGQRATRGDAAGAGIKALTVDDIWSQLQRTYLNKYTPQAQPVMDGGEAVPSAASKKQKRNSAKSKTRKHQQHPTVRTVNYENNYYNQEQPAAKHSIFYESSPQHKPTHSYSSFSPYSVGTSSSSDTDTDLFETQSNAATRPFPNYNSAIVFEGTTADESSSDDSLDEEDTLAAYNSDTSVGVGDVKQHPFEEDTSSEESMFSSSHKKFGNKRSHRHSYDSASYGNVNQNNPFNYHDLYASYSTPIAATVATHNVPVVSTYHPNSYGASPSPAASYQQLAETQRQNGPSPIQESTSYQWREQQHYPASSYQGYHTSATSSQQQQSHKRPQHQQLLQQQYPPQTTSALRLPKAGTLASSSLSLAQHHPLASSSPSSLNTFSENEFTAAVKDSSPQQQHQQQQQRHKKRKNRIKSKRNRIVVT